MTNENENVVTAKVTREDYLKVINALRERENQAQVFSPERKEEFFNNPISHVQRTRVVWNKGIQSTVLEGLVSFDGEEPAWVPVRTIRAIYSYINNTLNSSQI
jgi:hypothetical protein